MNGVKLKITQLGMETFSDYLGGVKFENGISVDPVPQYIAEHLSAIISIRTLDDKDPSQAALYAAIAKGEEPPVKYEEPIVEAKPAVSYDFTRESLEAVADAKGIAGLREVASQYGVSGKSIAGIIDELMALKGE